MRPLGRISAFVFPLHDSTLDDWVAGRTSEPKYTIPLIRFFPTHLENSWNFMLRRRIFGMISRFMLVPTLQWLYRVQVNLLQSNEW